MNSRHAFRGCLVLLLLSLSGLLFVGPRVVRADEASRDGFKQIFNGRDLNGWDGDPKFWSVEDDAITGRTTKKNPTKKNTFIVWRHGVLDDFELTLQYRIVGGNSGIQYRSFENEEKWGRWVVGGYQADLEAGDTYSGILYGERDRGILAKRGEKTVIHSDHKPEVIGEVGNSDEIQSHIKQEDWNDYHVIASGYHMIHKINGHVTADVTDEDLSMRKRSGILALQLHAGPPMTVQFRNIRLKRLKLPVKKKIVMIAGTKSHGYGAHEFNAGCRLLQSCLDNSMPTILTTVYSKGWPQDPTAFDNADAVLLYMNGGKKHPASARLGKLDQLMRRGVGLGALHYAVEVEKGAAGYYFLKWLGGYFEVFWSVNPHWVLSKTTLAEGHPITQGVQPFEIMDEWYFNMRFRDQMAGVVPILSATPPDEARVGRGEGARSGNPHVTAGKGQSEVLAWATERSDGGRGFGFTGGHDHWNWANDDFRTLILNACVWLTGAEVPAEGVPSRRPTQTELEANQDYPKPSEAK